MSPSAGFVNLRHSSHGTHPVAPGKSIHEPSNSRRHSVKTPNTTGRKVTNWTDQENKWPISLEVPSPGARRRTRAGRPPRTLSPSLDGFPSCCFFLASLAFFHASRLSHRLPPSPLTFSEMGAALEPNWLPQRDTLEKVREKHKQVKNGIGILPNDQLPSPAGGVPMRSHPRPRRYEVKAGNLRRAM